MPSTSTTKSHHHNQNDDGPSPVGDDLHPQSNKPASASSASKATRTKETLNVVTAALPIVGAVGTVFVWATANFYVGEVNIVPKGNYDALSIQVYDKRGQESTFNTPKFQLMPGSYHLVISPNNGSASSSDNASTRKHADIEVKFAEKTTVEVELSEAPSEAESSVTDPPKKRWWQFWRR